MGREREKFFQKLPSVLTSNPVEVVQIGDRKIGKGQPVFVIAEVSSNHHGNIKNALRFIDIAADRGADAVKFQHLKHNTIAADTVVYDSWHGKLIGELSSFYKSAELPYEWTERLAKHAEKKGIMFLSTPFDEEAVDVLDTVGVPAFKVASYEMTSDALLTYIAKRGKPIILSTGMAYLEEIAHAVRVIQEAGNNNIVLLHCVSLYPPKNFAELNLRAIETLRNAFKLPVGYSDHSHPPYIAAPLAAVALGACIIEKHFTDQQTGGSNDDPNSMAPDDFKRMVTEIRYVEEALSDSGIKQPVSRQGHEGDEIFDRWARRSLYAKRDIIAGTVITKDDVVLLRPADGIEPKHLSLIIGKKAVRDIKVRVPIMWEDLLQE